MSSLCAQTTPTRFQKDFSPLLVTCQARYSSALKASVNQIVLGEHGFDAAEMRVLALVGEPDFFAFRKEDERHAELIGITPYLRLVGAILLGQNDEWAVQRARYMTLEALATMSEDPLLSLPAVAA